MVLNESTPVVLGEYAGGVRKITISNVGAAALTGLYIQARRGNAPWETLAGSAVAFRNLTNLIAVLTPPSNPDITALAPGQTADVLLDSTQYSSVRVSATGLPGADATAVADSFGSGGSSSTAGYVPKISQYDRALIFPLPRQANAVLDISRNINDLQYVGAITDAEVYDTEAGAIASGIATSKALAFHWQKMLWELAAGESLFLQARIKTVGATTSSNVLFGNSDATVEGLSLTLYGPTHATTPGRLMVNFKATGAGGLGLVVTPYSSTASSVTVDQLGTDVYHNITIHVDGATRLMNVWVNTKQGGSGMNAVLTGGSTVNPTPRNFGIGYAPADDSWTSSNAKATRLQAFRFAVFPAGVGVVNPGWLDLQFNQNPSVLFSDVDYVGSN